MPDILLTVDYEFETDLSSSVSTLISKINASPPKIKIDFELSKADISKLKNQISSSLKDLNIDTGKAVTKAVQANQNKTSVATKATKESITAAKNAALAVKQIAAERSKAEKLLSSLSGYDKDDGKKLSAETESYLKKVNSLASKYGISGDGKNISSLTGEYKEFGTELTNLQTKYISLKDAADSFFSGQKSGKSNTKNAALAVKQIAAERSKAEKLLSSLSGYDKDDGKKLSAETESYLKKVNSLASKYGISGDGKNISSLTGEYKEFGTELTKLRTEYISLKDAADSFFSGQKSSESNTKNVTEHLQKYYKLLADSEAVLEKYTAAKNGGSESRKAYNEIKEQYNKLSTFRDEAKSSVDSKTVSADFTSAVDKASDSVANNTNVIKENGNAHASLGDKIQGAVQKFSSWLSVSTLVMTAVRSVKQMVSASKELDTAMTELKKVTDETDATYSKFLTNASKRATSMGASVADTITATADFARLGYNLSDAENLADASIVYKNVGDGIESISDASDSIISTMQAFGVSADDAMTIVDKFNEVGNNYAISSEGIGEAMLKSASSMNAAGNSLDETIALITAANTVVQNPESVGEFMPNNTAMY